MLDPINHLPATRAELDARGWAELDVVIITGDAHVDHPSFPAAILGRVLEADGWRVGVIPRPDVSVPATVARLGRPRLTPADHLSACPLRKRRLSGAAHHVVARRRLLRSRERWAE